MMAERKPSAATTKQADEPDPVADEDQTVAQEALTGYALGTAMGEQHMSGVDVDITTLDWDHWAQKGFDDVLRVAAQNGQQRAG
jgi:hypothetical protein